MRLLNTRPDASAILFLIFLLFISHVAAQGLPKLPGGDEDDKDATTDKTAATTDAKATDSAKETGTDSDTETDKPTETTDSATPTKLPGVTSKTDLKPGLTGLPKLKGQDYPPPTVPPTADAPFMQKSNLPEGTVFIAVGAGLGFFGFMVLVWRGFLAWSVHRSVKRAAMAHIAKYEGKDPNIAVKTKKGYISTGPGSTLSLDQLGAMGMGKGGTSKTASPHTSLFFSPTAGAGMQSNANRGSGYLPAGYYASGTAAPAAGAGMTHVGGGVPMTNLAKSDRRYSKGNSRGASRGATPPQSPSLPPSRGAESMLSGRLSTQGLVGHPSNNSLTNLNVAPQGRAPSAYLEDLFESHTPPRSPKENRRESGRRF